MRFATSRVNSKCAYPTFFGTSRHSTLHCPREFSRFIFLFLTSFLPSSTIIMVKDKVKNSKMPKSGIPSGIPSSGIPSTRSGKARYISDFYQNSGKKSGNSPTKSSAKSTSSSPLPCFGTPPPQGPQLSLNPPIVPQKPLTIKLFKTLAHPFLATFNWPLTLSLWLI